MTPIYFAILFVVAMANCEEFYMLGHEFPRTPLGDQIDKASVKMLKEAYLSSDDANVVTSPLGVILLLSLYSSGAAGASRDEITKLLGTSDYKELFDNYSRLSNKFASMDSNSLTLSNKIYTAKGYTLADQFSETARAYNSEVETLDFRNPTEAAKTINEWAERKSNGHIKDPVSEDILSEDIAAALFNIIFFQGHWHVPFEASKTEEKDFHVNRSLTVKKPMMRLQDSLFYKEDNAMGVKMIELPYQEDGFRMVVILPNEVDGLATVLEKVSQVGLLEDIFDLWPAGREINLYMPKFEINSKLDYTEILPKLDVKGIFSEGAAGIVKERPVAISKFFQEAVVKVDEEGATAGAFTGAIMVPMSSNSKPPEPMDFIVDHPFMFTILYKDVILFIGTYTH
ncbi:antichymotrypsin-1-like [Battus philenor]|uniref:antichymotrypsin-1-like n=1 Tax=Battus philenor TaxID=42288 RepID=UPI0035CEC9B6